MTIQKLSFIFYLVTGILISLLTLFIVLRFFEQRELERFRRRATPRSLQPTSCASRPMT